MKYFLTISLLLSIYFAGAQDTLKVMHYNLLNYGNITDYCTLNNNDPNDKKAWLKTIVDFYLPDILTVNELGTSPVYHQQILNDVLNTGGRNYFAMAAATNLAESDIINMLYYNSNKLVLAWQDVVAHYLRDINMYKLYHKLQPGNSTDTAFIHLFVAHFKAGSSGSDKTTRADMAQAIRTYVEANNITDACLMMGDLNLQNSSEQAWQNLTNGTTASFNFSDPLDMEGYWHNNADFASVHTQSTHINSNGCASAGGMDDRFDFIMTNPALSQPEYPVRFVDGSYQNIGQDGQRFNGSLIDPPNNSAPANVINALYEMSDHVPIMLKLSVDVNTNDLPPSWNYTTTASTHIVVIPLATNPSINGSPISAGDYIGVFYLDDGLEKCAGHVQWNATGNIALVAYGNDISSDPKDGFNEGESMIFKIHSMGLETDFYADPTFDLNWASHDGMFESGGISSILKLEASYLQSHTIIINEGWSSVSSFLIPKWKSLEDIFGVNYSNLIFVSSKNQIYYPHGGINNLVYWQKNASLIIKSSAAFNFDLEGLPNNTTTVELFAGWNIIPIPVACFVSVEFIMEELQDKVEVIKMIVGTQVFWPEMGISTLQELIPGNAYYIKVNEDCQLDFGECGGK